MIESNLHKGASKELFEFAKQNRQSATEAEELLWQSLRNRKLNGYKFRRQHPISNFIVDFYCHESRLVVEVDGGYHKDREQKEYDDGRTYELKELGVKVIRFDNKEVIVNLNKVLNIIEKHLNPNPSP